MKSVDKLFMKKEDFFNGAIESKKFQEITEEIRKEEEGELVNEIRLKRNRAWNKLGSQIVGAEEF